MGKNRLGTLVLRFKTEIFTMILIGVFFLGLFSLFFPGEEVIHTMVDLIYQSALAGLFQSMDTESPGWVLWISLILFLLLFYILAFAGINIGTKLIPTVEEDGIDVSLANASISARRLYIRNYLGGIVSLILILLPIYGIVAIFSWIHTSLFILDELAYAFVILLVSGIFFLSLTSMANIVRFSKSFGKTVGFSYLILGFILDLLSDSPDYADFAKLSINQYLNPVQVIFAGVSTSNWQEIWQPSFVVLGISFIFVLFGDWRVKHPDYLERVKETSPDIPSTTFMANTDKAQQSENSPAVTIVNYGITEEPQKTKPSFRNAIRRWKTRMGKRFSFFDPGSAFSQKFPVFMNQFRGNMTVFGVLLAIVTLFLFALFRAIPAPDELIAQIEQSNTPIFAAFAQNHLLPASLLGFLILKFYDALWMYFGIAVAILCANIASKDVHTSTHDLIFANNLSPTRVIFARILSFVISFSIYLWGTFFIMRGIQSTVDFEFAFSTQLSLFTVLWIHYLGMGIFFVGLTLIPQVSKGKNVAIFTFIGFILLAVLPYLNPDIEFLKYASYLNYFDPVGIILGEVTFVPSFLRSLVMCAGSILFTFLMVKFKFAHSDLR